MDYQSLPKVELHLHLDGSFRFDTLWELSQQENMNLPGDGTKEGYITFIRHCANAQSVNEYLKMFDDPLRLMQTKENIQRITKELIEDLAAQGHVYAEIRFAPQLHTQKGLSQEEALLAVLAGKEEALTLCSSIDVGIITCMMSLGAETVNWQENLETIEICKKYLGKGVVALDLAGAEGIIPLSNFAGLFEKAKEYHLPCTCHAGDSVGPETMEDALSFGVKRVGHGHHLYEDEKLTAIYAIKGICLEICPTSNIQCKARESYELHPAKKLLDKGVPISLSTDNMTLAGVTLVDEFYHAVQRMGFSDEDIWRMNMNGILYSFADENTKKAVLMKLYQFKKDMSL